MGEATYTSWVVQTAVEPAQVTQLVEAVWSESRLLRKDPIQPAGPNHLVLPAGREVIDCVIEGDGSGATRVKAALRTTRIKQPKFFLIPIGKKRIVGERLLRTLFAEDLTRRLTELDPSTAATPVPAKLNTRSRWAPAPVKDPSFRPATKDGAPTPPPSDAPPPPPPPPPAAAS